MNKDRLRRPFRSLGGWAHVRQVACALACCLFPVAATGGPASHNSHRAATSALFDSLLGGSEDDLVAALNSGANPNATDPDGKSTIQCAVEARHFNMLTPLLQRGARVPRRYPVLCDLLPRCAAATNAVDTSDLVRKLVAAGANVNARDGDGCTALMLAGFDGKIDPGVVKTLLYAGARVNDRDKTGAGALSYAAQNPDGAEIVRLLLANGANLHTRGRIAFEGPSCFSGLYSYRPPLLSPLAMAVEQGDPESARLLLDFGARIDDPENAGAHFCAKAVERDGSSMLAVLLDHGGNVNESDSRGRSLLMAAIVVGNPAAAELLVRRGATVDWSDNQGTSPLMLAALVSDEHSVELLVKHSANVNLRNRAGETALYTARRGLTSARNHGRNASIAAAIVALLESGGATE